MKSRPSKPMQTLRHWSRNFAMLVTMLILGTALVLGVQASCQASPVKLLQAEAQGIRVYGSCVHIGNGVYLTARHLFEASPEIPAEDWKLTLYDDKTGPDEYSFSATYGNKYEPMDMAYLTSDHVASEAFAVKPSQDYQSKEPFTLIGWEPETSDDAGTLIDFEMVTRGDGTYVGEWRNGDTLLGAHITCDAHSGNSGGAVIDANNYLIGIVSSRIDSVGSREHNDCLTASGAGFTQVCDEIRTSSPVCKAPLFVWTQEACGPCRQFERDLFGTNLRDNPDNNFRELIEEQYQLVKVDVNQQPFRGTHIIPRLSISTTPTFVRGDLGTRTTGYRGMEELLVWLGIDPRRLHTGPQAATPPPQAEPPPTETVPEEPEVEPGPIETVPDPAPEACPVPQQTEGPGFFGRVGGAVIKHLPTVVGWAAALGIVGTPVGLTGWAAWALISLAKRRKNRYASQPKSQPEAQPKCMDIGDAEIRDCQKPIVIETQAPPLPQQVLKETQFAPYEKNTFNEAFSWAVTQLSQKYPATVDTLNTLQAYIDQYLKSLTK